MTAAYAAINNRGVYVKPTAFEEIRGPGGQLLWSRRIDGPRGRRAVDSDVADTMTWMLQRVVTGGTGVAAKLGDRPVAGKTGTSEGGRDLWFIGSIPQLTTGVWFGYDDSRETKFTSGESAWAWKQFMTTVKGSFPVQQFPPKPVLTRTYNGPKDNSWDRSTIVKPKKDKKKPEDGAETMPSPDEIIDTLIPPSEELPPFLLTPVPTDDSGLPINSPR